MADLVQISLAQKLYSHDNNGMFATTIEQLTNHTSLAIRHMDWMEFHLEESRWSIKVAKREGLAGYFLASDDDTVRFSETRPATPEDIDLRDTKRR